MSPQSNLVSPGADCNLNIAPAVSYDGVRGRRSLPVKWVLPMQALLARTLGAGTWIWTSTALL